MECPHLSESIKVHIIQEKTELTKKWQCAVCGTTQSLWLCLVCGNVGCGRYVNGHAKQHGEENTAHPLCIDCDAFAVYCYACDEFAVNDTEAGELKLVRQALTQRLGEPVEDVGDAGDDAKSLNFNKENDAEAAAAIEQEVLWKSDESLAKEMQENVRILRPRAKKRSYWSDSNGENSQCKRQDVSLKNANAKARDKKVVGLRNLGNTCFMNAVLHSLSTIQEFCYYFKQLPSLEANTRPGLTTRRLYHSRSYCEINEAIMTEELRKVLVGLNQGGCKGAISPESLFLVIWKVVPRFRGYQQQDAHEFLRYMLDRLHTELLHLLPDFSLKDNPYISLEKSTSSIVTTVFGGTLQSEVCCLNCTWESKKHDPFLDLSLDIPEKFQCQRKGKDGEETSPQCNIADCLTSFIEVEELAETELYYCNNCKSKQRSTKRFWIRRLPNVLCLHLKRFRWHNSFRTKIDTDVTFPVTALDMSQFVLSNLHETRRSGTGSNLYDLAAIIVHHGSGAGSGHYTAFAVKDASLCANCHHERGIRLDRQKEDTYPGQWFHFNDSTVRPTMDDVVAKCKPYILFYIRREFRLPQVSS